LLVGGGHAATLAGRPDLPVVNSSNRPLEDSLSRPRPPVPRSLRWRRTRRTCMSPRSWRARLQAVAKRLIPPRWRWPEPPARGWDTRY